MIKQENAVDVALPIRGSSLPPVLREFCRNCLLLTIVSAAYCVLMARVWHFPYPYNWPLWPPSGRFGDFTIYAGKFALLRQPAFWTTGFPFTYPAPTGVLFAAFYKGFGAHALGVFEVFMLLAFAVPAAIFFRSLRRRGVGLVGAGTLAAVVLFTSWPAAIVFDRGNVEIFVWVALACGTWAFARGKEWTAAILFGLAASLKLFPFVYLLLFFTRRRFPKLLAGAGTFGAVTLLSLEIMGPTVKTAYQGVASGLQAFHDMYMVRFLGPETGVDHTPLAFAKTIVAVRPHPTGFLEVPGLYRLFMAGAVVGGTVLYFAVIRKLPWRNQLLVLSIVSIYFTPFSGDGTLMHLYYGFALCCFVALDAFRKRIVVPGLRTMFLSFAYLLSTESFLIFHVHRFEGQGKCIALAVLLVCALRFPLGPPLLAQAGEESTGAVLAPDTDRIAGALPMEAA